MKYFAAAVICLAAGTASAATVSKSTVAPTLGDALMQVLPATSFDAVNTPGDPVTIVVGGQTRTYRIIADAPSFGENVTGNVANEFVSPYTALDYSGSAPGEGPAELTAQGFYTYLGANTVASYEFATDQMGMSFLWGSPDTFNIVEFYDDGIQVDLSVIDGVAGMGITGTEFAGITPGTATSGIRPLWLNEVGIDSAFATFGGFKFDELRLISSDPQARAFEYAMLTTIHVPLPAAGWLLLAAVAGLAARSRALS